MRVARLMPFAWLVGAALLLGGFAADAGAAPVLIAAAASWAGGALAAAIGLTGFAATAFGAAFSFIANSFASTLFGKESGPTQDTGGGGFVAEARNRTQVVRSAAEPRALVIGEVMKSGPLIYAETTGSSNQYLHLVIPIAPHEVFALGEIRFNDVVVGAVDGSGNVTTGQFAGFCRVKKRLGAAGQVADADLIAESGGKWTSAHVGNGVADVYLRLEWNQSVYPTGIPNIKVLTKGAIMEDPRDSVERYTNNWAIGVRWYLKRAAIEGGLEADDDEISETDAIAAANLSDERVRMAAHTNVFTVDAATNLVTLTDSEKIIATGDGVRGTTTGTLPAPLALSTSYYWSRVSDTTGYFCSTVQDALEGVSINLTDAGSGVHTATHWDQARYTANGTIDTSKRPLDIMRELMTAGAGTLTYPAGEFRIFGGAYTTPAGSLDESDLRGPMSTRRGIPRAERFNGFRGKYSNPANFWQPSDFPPVTNASYVTDDGEEIWRDIDLPFTTDAVRAQRLAKIHLEESRMDVVVDFPAKMTGFDFAVWETANLSIDKYGWAPEVLRVAGWRLGAGGVGVDLKLRKTLAANYDWASGDATVVDPAPDTNLPSTAVSALASFALSSGTADLFIAGDGTVVSRIKASWTAVANIFVTSGGHIEAQYKKSADSIWQDAPDVAGSATSTFIGPVDDGVNYDVRARAVNSIGVEGSWSTVSAHTVAGKTAAPTTPSGFTAQQSGPGTVLFACDSIEDADLKRIEVRLLDFGDETWANGIPVCNILKGFTSTTGAVQPGNWTFLAASFDTSENQSAANARIDLEVTADGFTAVINRQDYPDWLGTLTNMVKRYDGTLTAESQSLASALGWEVFDQFVPNPYTTCTYEAPALDKSIDGSLRVYADIVSELGPGVSTGIANPQHSIDYKLAAGSYDGFENWAVGYADFRYLKSKLTLDTSVGNAAIRGFNTVADGQARQETASAVTVGPTGTAVTFAAPFHSAPIIAARNEGATPLLPTVTGASGTGATLHLYNTSGTEVGGTGGYTATGV